MWTRVELKDKAKGALRANYWKAVLVGVLLLFASGMSGMASAPGDVSSMALSDAVDTANTDTTTHYYHYDDYGNYDDYDYYDYDDVYGGADLPDEGSSYSDEGYVYSDEYYEMGDGPVAMAFAILGLICIFLVIVAFVVALDVLILNPLEVGAKRFFLRDLNQKAEVKEIAYAFDNGNFVNTIKTMFLRDLFIVLWTMLFIIPGIVKSYEYRMIPYLLGEDPAMTKEVAFAESKRVMDGQKWNTFVLDLSFLGWHILSVCTLGILSVFYVTPYQGLTNAALYEKLRYGQPTPAPQAYGPAAHTPVSPFAPAAGTIPVAPTASMAPVTPVAGPAPATPAPAGYAPAAYGTAPTAPMAPVAPAAGAPASAAGYAPATAPATSMAPQPPAGFYERAEDEPSPTSPADGAGGANERANSQFPSEAQATEPFEAPVESCAQPGGDAEAAEAQAADDVASETAQQLDGVAPEEPASATGDDEVAPR